MGKAFDQLEKSSINIEDYMGKIFYWQIGSWMWKKFSSFSCCLDFSFRIFVVFSYFIGCVCLYSYRSLPASQLIQDTSPISDVTDREEEAEEEEENTLLVSNKQVMDVSRSSGDDFTERKRSVMQALHLMQTNPKVQVCGIV